MPIKIKDPAVYECYDSAMCQTETGNPAELFEEFASQINNLDDSDGLSIENILTVTDAIWNGWLVELEEPKYALRLKNRTKYLFLTATLPVNFPNAVHLERAFSLSSTRRYMTDDAWNEVFIETPWIDKDAFEKVYVDD